ncbi:MAG: GspH/FimT family pseudopilin [Pseudomonadota bacterium]
MREKSRAGKPWHFSSGLTMIEMLMVLALIGIAAALAVPGFSRWLPDYRLRRAVNVLHAHLQQAKLTAVKQNCKCSIRYETDPDRYIMSVVGKTVYLEDYGDQGDILFVNNPQTGGSSPPAPTINFNSRGIISSSGVTGGVTASYAYLSNRERRAYYRVGSTTAGEIRTQKWTGTSWQ